MLSAMLYQVEDAAGKKKAKEEAAKKLKAAKDALGAAAAECEGNGRLVEELKARAEGEAKASQEREVMECIIYNMVVT